MELRRAFFPRVMRVLDQPRVRRALADPRALDIFVAVARARDRATELVFALRSRRRSARRSS